MYGRTAVNLSVNVIEGAVITFTEISIIKQAQAALRDSEAMRRLAIVVRDALDAILVQDLMGRILAWNPGAETGASPTSLAW